jgi:VanZ family protein
VLVIFALSSVPGSMITSAVSRYPALTTEGFSFFVHLVEYAILAGLLLFATGWRPPTVALALALLLACSLLAAGDVAYRRFVPGRHADPIDWVADTAGAGVAIAAIEVVRRRRAQPDVRVRGD